MRETSIGAMSIKIIRSSSIYHSLSLFMKLVYRRKFYFSLGSFTSSSFARIWFLFIRSMKADEEKKNRWRIKNEINQSKIKIIDWIPFWELCLKFHIFMHLRMSWSDCWQTAAAAAFQVMAILLRIILNFQINFFQQHHSSSLALIYCIKYRFSIFLIENSQQELRDQHRVS